MTNAVVVARAGSVPALVAEMAEKAAGYVEAAKASNTRRAGKRSRPGAQARALTPCPRPPTLFWLT